jgi:hypothetical protein
MKAKTIMQRRTDIIVSILLIVVILGAWFGWSDKTMGTLLGWGASILISVILSGVCGTMIENVSGDSLKKISIPITIGKYTFSVSLFVIVTLLLKFIIFRSG